VDERITQALAASAGPMPLAAIRAACRVRNATLRERLAALTAAGQLVRDADGYRLAAG
jgi:DNA-binding IclR family transcriptional regulator